MKTGRLHIILLIVFSTLLLSWNFISSGDESVNFEDIKPKEGVATISTEIASDIDAAVRHFNESKKSCSTSFNNVSLSSPNSSIQVRRKDNNESSSSCHNAAGILHYRYFNHSTLPYLFQTEFLESKVHLILLKRLII